jgi:hypothetical protein
MTFETVVDNPVLLKLGTKLESILNSNGLHTHPSMSYVLGETKLCSFCDNLASTITRVASMSDAFLGGSCHMSYAAPSCQRCKDTHKQLVLVRSNYFIPVAHELTDILWVQVPRFKGLKWLAGLKPCVRNSRMITKYFKLLSKTPGNKLIIDEVSECSLKTDLRKQTTKIKTLKDYYQTEKINVLARKIQNENFDVSIIDDKIHVDHGTKYIIHGPMPVKRVIKQITRDIKIHLLSVNIIYHQHDFFNFKACVEKNGFHRDVGHMHWAIIQKITDGQPLMSFENASRYVNRKTPNVDCNLYPNRVLFK